MDAFNPNATTPQEFQGGTPNWRTDLYSTGGTLLTHKESIQLIKSLGAQVHARSSRGPTAAPSCRSRPCSAARRPTPRR